jgi:hypothetical protein
LYLITFAHLVFILDRGRYDIKVFQSFFQLHGKTFDYKIPASTVLRLFLLPHKDGRQIFFVVSYTSLKKKLRKKSSLIYIFLLCNSGKPWSTY